MKLAEALALGRSAQRLVNLSTAHARLSGGGSVTVKTTDGNLTYALTGIDIEAVLALLIEREVAFLTPYNVECLS